MPASDWDQRFLATTRGQIVARLARAARTVDELASALGITDNAVRAHLTSLERDGLVAQTGVRRSATRPAKPAFVYDITPAAERLFPTAYAPVLSHTLDVLRAHFGRDSLAGFLREVGARIAGDAGLTAHRSRTTPDRIQHAISVLEELGADIAVEPDTPRLGTLRVRGYRCPLSAVASGQPDACVLVEEFLATALGAPVTTCCERDGRPRCCFDVDLSDRRVA